jgi:predicted CoA-binding protein
MIDERMSKEFLALGRLAVVGASPDDRQFGNVVYRELREHGVDVVPVHPSATTVAGDPAFPGVESVDGPLDGVIVMVPADKALEVVRACARRGVRHVWLFKGLGSAGAVSDEVLRECARHDIEVVAGACPLMFLEPVGLVHRIHRAARRVNHSLVRTPAGTASR